MTDGTVALLPVKPGLLRTLVGTGCRLVLVGVEVVEVEVGTGSSSVAVGVSVGISSNVGVGISEVVREEDDRVDELDVNLRELTEIELVILLQVSVPALQKYPGSQQPPKEHCVHPASHGIWHIFEFGRHIVPFLQHLSPSLHR